MLNKNLQLNPHVFDQDVEKTPIRNGFGDGLVEAAEKNKNVVGLCADLTESTRMEAFAKKFPERFIEIGIAEQNLASVASGMAVMGKIPFISSYAMFSPGRNWEQIRTTICYNDVGVKIAGSHAGVSVGPDGGTHQALEDIALMRVLPNMVVICPCDVHEARKATVVTSTDKKPTYIRLAREKSPVITTKDTPFEIGRAYEFFRSGGEKADVGIISTGVLTHQALLAAKQLDDEGIKVVLLHMPTVKPIDEDALKDIILDTGALVTVEEHQVAGGLGSIVAEFASAFIPVPIEFVGVHNQFGQSGTPHELLNFYKLNTETIVKKAYKVLSRK